MGSRRHFMAAGLGACAWWASSAVAAAADRVTSTRLVVALDQRASLLHLPLTIAERLGYFEAEGVSVELREFGSPSSAAQAVLRREAHLLCAPLGQFGLARDQANQALLRSFVLLSRTPQLVLGLSIKTLPQDAELVALRGRRIGVPAIGSMADRTGRALLRRAFVAPEDLEWVPLAHPFAAVQAFRNGQVDALCYSDPAIRQLEQLGELRAVVDTRSLRGCIDVFGGPLPSACLGAPASFLSQYPRSSQAVADAVVRALKWLQSAEPADVIKVVPEPYFLGDRYLYLQAFVRTRDAWSGDGVMPTSGVAVVRDVFEAGDAAGVSKAMLDDAYTNELALRAKQRWRV